MTDDFAAFQESNRRAIAGMAADAELHDLTHQWMLRATRHAYSYHFRWLGLPIIQYPQDIVAMQELIWATQPDLVIETGIARGGSLVFYASMLALLGGERRVLGIDIDLRPHNRAAIEAHPMASCISIIDGSSVDPAVARKVHDFAARYERAMVVLDSNHAHEHVLNELRLYSPLVRPGGYLVVFDTIVERTPDDLIVDRPWRKGNSPWSAVQAFLAESDRFAIDHELDHKLQISVCPNGYLTCVR